MSRLNYRNKMKAIYLLYKKGGEGVVAKTGGAKINEGCLLVPESESAKLVDMLTALVAR
jgi:hypothetical protein